MFLSVDSLAMVSSMLAFHICLILWKKFCTLFLHHLYYNRYMLFNQCTTFSLPSLSYSCIVLYMGKQCVCICLWCHMAYDISKFWTATMLFVSICCDYLITLFCLEMLFGWVFCTVILQSKFSPKWAVLDPLFPILFQLYWNNFGRINPFALVFFVYWFVSAVHAFPS